MGFCAGAELERRLCLLGAISRPYHSPVADSYFLAADLLLGGFLGFIGQGIRVVVGLKKMHDETASAGVSASDAFSSAQLSVSLLIGFIAGDFQHYVSLNRDTVLGIMASGYAGADFVEGFAKRAMPGTTPAGTQPSSALGTSPVESLAPPVG